MICDWETSALTILTWSSTDSLVEVIDGADNVRLRDGGVPPAGNLIERLVGVGLAEAITIDHLPSERNAAAFNVLALAPLAVTEW